MTKSSTIVIKLGYGPLSGAEGSKFDIRGEDEYESLLDKYAAAVLQGTFNGEGMYFRDEYKHPETGETRRPSNQVYTDKALADGFKLHRTANQVHADYCFEMAGEMIEARMRFLNKPTKVE